MTTEIAKQDKPSLSKEETLNLMRPVSERLGLEQAAQKTGPYWLLSRRGFSEGTALWLG